MTFILLCNISFLIKVVCTLLTVPQPQGMWLPQCLMFRKISHQISLQLDQCANAFYSYHQLNLNINMN